MRALSAGQDPGLPLAEGYPLASSLAAMQLVVEHGDEAHLGWFLVLAEDGQVVGDCATKGWVDEAGAVEIGYSLAPGHRRRGLGTEAVTVLVAWLRGHPEVRTVVADVDEGNVASQRLLARLGFVVAREDSRRWTLESRP